MDADKEYGFIHWPSARGSAFTDAATDILSDAGIELPHIDGDLAGMLNPLPERAGEKALEERQGLLWDAIDDPSALPDVLDDARLTQDAHVVRNPRLLHSKDENQLADTELAPAEQEHDPEAGSGRPEP